MLITKLTTNLIVFIILLLSLSQPSFAATSCVYCGEGTEYPDCFSFEFMKKKAVSVLKGCVDIKRDKMLESDVETPTVRQKRLELKLMKEFCADPTNNQGTACTKFHYSRIGKSD